MMIERVLLVLGFPAFDYVPGVIIVLASDFWCSGSTLKLTTLPPTNE